MEREREKKRGARYLDIVLLTFTVGICNAYRLLNRAAYKALDPQDTSHIGPIFLSECGEERAPIETYQLLNPQLDC